MSQRPGGFLGPSCGCRASTGRALCGSATRPNRPARGSKPTDLVLSGPRVYRLSIDRAGGGRAAASPSSTGGTKPWGSLYRCRAARGAARRRGATVERLWRRPSARRRVACGGEVCGSARRERAAERRRSIFTRSGAGRTADTSAHAKAVPVDAVARKTPHASHYNVVSRRRYRCRR